MRWVSFGVDLSEKERKPTATVVRCTDPSEKTVTNSSFVPLLVGSPSFVGHMSLVALKQVARGTCLGREACTSSVAQREKKSGSSIMQPQMRKMPSTVTVKRMGPEL